MSYKANALADELVSTLTVRLSAAPSYQGAAAIAVAKAFDTDGQPMITIGTQAAGSKSATIKIGTTTQMSAMPQNSLGLAATVFTPHVAQVIIEGISATGTFPLGFDNLTLIAAEVLARGTRYELYVTATAVAPTIANKPATPAVAVDSLYWPLTSTM